jgi:hypothetical protein
VLVTGALMALIAATLLRMSMLRYQMGGRGAAVLQEKRDDQGAMANVISAWNNVNSVCGANPPTFGAGCGGNPGVCSCTCTQAVTGVTVTAAVVSGVCRLTLTSPSL